MEPVERELREFLEECKKQQFNESKMRTICQPLLWHMRFVRLRRWTQWLLLPAILAYLLWSYCDTCAWTLSALGRLFLIQLLPYWNWTPLYNAKCLIERAEVFGTQRLDTKPLGKQETLWENCALCESLDTIPTLSNVSYSLLESEYLERGLPVIVTDCSQLELNLESLLQRILDKSPQLLSSEPCDVSSNLLLRHLFNIDAALQKIRALHQSSTSWHLQFRNCDPKAVKASRLFASRPYFYPLHLEPYYSSWLLMAHNVHRPQTDIYVRGLIFVQQLSGHFEYRLRPKQPCSDGICPNLSLRLSSGECLVFSTDLWILSYGLQKLDAEADQSSIATVFEVNWQL